MSQYNIAVLVDNFVNSPTTQNILIECLQKPQYKVTIFTMSKENIIANSLPVLNIADYFSWNGPTLITSPKTLEKSIKYPSPGPCIIIGNAKYQNYYNVPNFNLDLVGKIINEHNANVGRPNPSYINEQLSNEQVSS